MQSVPALANIADWCGRVATVLATNLLNVARNDASHSAVGLLNSNHSAQSEGIGNGEMRQRAKLLCHEIQEVGISYIIQHESHVLCKHGKSRSGSTSRRSNVRYELELVGCFKKSGFSFYDILAFFGPLFSRCFTPYDIVFFGPPSPFTFQNVNNDGQSILLGEERGSKQYSPCFVGENVAGRRPATFSQKQGRMLV